MRKSLLVLLLAAVTAGVPAAAGAGTAVEPELLLPRNFPDPEVSRFGSDYYAFATGTKDIRAPFATAPSATGPWKFRGDALPERPPWMARNSGVWAPDVSRRADGKYLMYFSGARASDGSMCVGAALADTVTAPYHAVAKRPLVCRDRDHGDIDPASFVDSDGSRYLIYKANGGKKRPAVLYLQPMRADGVTPVGTRVELLRSDRPVEEGIVEAPTIVRVGSRFVLLYSIKHFRNTDYQTTYATAPSLTGPYTKSGHPLISRQTLGGGLDGPGSADVVTGDGRTHAFFHAWYDRAKGIRAFYAVGLRFDGARPVVVAP